MRIDGTAAPIPVARCDMADENESAQPPADKPAEADPRTRPVGRSAGGTTRAPANGSKGNDFWAYLGAIGFGLVVLLLLPVSCGKMMPGAVGRYYREAYKDRCDECAGTGKVAKSCATCRGRGYFGGVRCATCGGTGRADPTCPYCAGSGKKPGK
jgi:hypothetical protein